MNQPVCPKHPNHEAPWCARSSGAGGRAPRVVVSRGSRAQVASPSVGGQRGPPLETPGQGPSCRRLILRDGLGACPRLPVSPDQRRPFPAVKDQPSCSRSPKSTRAPETHFQLQCPPFLAGSPPTPGTQVAPAEGSAPQHASSLPLGTRRPEGRACLGFISRRAGAWLGKGFTLCACGPHVVWWPSALCLRTYSP